MSKILFVRDSKSPLSLAITSHFKGAGLDIIEVRPDIDALAKVKEQMNGIMVYVDDKLREQPHSLNYITGMSEKDNIPIFTIGLPEELEAVRGSLPRHMVSKEYQRPVKVTDMVEDVIQFVNIYAMHQKKRILYVDDSGAMLRTVKGWLAPYYNVFLANSAAMAIKSISLKRPDLILLDYEMPVINGKQVLEMIRAEAEFSEIPAMFLTSKNDSESIRSVLSLNPEGYLLKTMEPNEILRSIEEYFKKYE